MSLLYWVAVPKYLSLPLTWGTHWLEPRTPSASAATVFEKPSSADRNTTVFGCGWARSWIALTIEPAYSVAGESTAKVRLYPFSKILLSAPAESAITWPLRSMTAACASVAADPYDE